MKETFRKKKLFVHRIVELCIFLHYLTTCFGEIESVFLKVLQHINIVKDTLVVLFSFALYNINLRKISMQYLCDDSLACLRTSQKWNRHHRTSRDLVGKNRLTPPFTLVELEEVINMIYHTFCQPKRLETTFLPQFLHDNFTAFVLYCTIVFMQGFYEGKSDFYWALFF